MTFLLLLLALINPAVDDIVTSPSPAVAGQELVITVPESSSGKILSLASPFGSWQQDIKLQGKTEIKVIIPKSLPLVQVSLAQPNDFESLYKIVPLVNRNGENQPGSKFWQAYLLAGFPSPFPVEINQEKALILAAQAYSDDPDNLINLELLWRLQAKEANDNDKRDLFLDEVDKKMTASPSGRLALAASTVHLLLGDPQGASVINGAQSNLIAPVQQIFQDKWRDIVTTPSLARRTARFQSWLEEDPFNPLGSQVVQILAATFSARKDYLNTARFGILSLRVIPEDAMTLNGVALAMAEGEFQLERGLMLSERAVSILNSPDGLRKPAHLDQQQWNRELINARAAAIETKAWLLSKLKRYSLAKQNFDLSASMHPTDELYLHYGKMLIDQKNTVEARRILNKGLQLNGPRSQEIKMVLRNLGK